VHDDSDDEGDDVDEERNMETIVNKILEVKQTLRLPIELSTVRNGIWL
jgi:hypothetical protein